jgi:hypothetical protein
LKKRSLQASNGCFKNERNAVVGVFLQRLKNLNVLTLLIEIGDLKICYARFFKNIAPE